jgi:hypothetical protein
MASSIAFFCAEEPSAFRVPVAQLSPPELLVPALAAGSVLSSLPHAVSSRAPTARAAAVREKRVSFTVMSSRTSALSS